MLQIPHERLTGIVVGFGFVGLVLSTWLVYSELFREATCPQLLGVPACYLVLAGYVIATIGAWRSHDVTFYAGAVPVTLIGVYFTLSHLGNTAQCPSFEGLPMCYLSLATGFSMLALYEIARRQRVR